LRQFFPGAEVGAEQAFVDTDHRDQGQVRQVVALGQHLRADQDPGALAQFGQQRFQGVATARAAAVHAQHRHVREPLCERFLQPFGADALGLQRQPAAVRAGRRNRLARAAVVALQPPAAAVHRHRGVAAPALRAPAAVVAQQHRGVAAAILEHQDLATGRQRAADRRQQLRRQAGLQRSLAHVEHAHRGRPGHSGAVRQAQVRVAARAGVVQRFQRRGRAAEQDRHAQRLAAHQREVARVVADAVELLVAAVVLLVDDDQAGVRQRREHRRARADDHPRLATPGGGPDPCALAVGEARMQRMHGHAEAGAEARQHLRRQADLRHQHQRLAATRQAVGDRLEVDLGLAAAGDAIQQQRREAVPGRGSLDRIDRGLLLGIGHERVRAGRRGKQVGRDRDAFGHAALRERARGTAPAGTGFGIERVLVARMRAQAFGQLSRLAGAQAGQCGLAGLGQLPRPGMGFGQGIATSQRRRQRRGQHLAQRGVGVARQPAQRLQQLTVEQRLRIQLSEDWAQLGAVGHRPAADHDPDQFAVAEWHPHPGADGGVPRRHARGRQVIECLRQRQRQRHLAGKRGDGGNRHRGSLAAAVERPRSHGV
jgi:hypothetical protein